MYKVVEDIFVISEFLCGWILDLLMCKWKMFLLGEYSAQEYVNVQYIMLYSDNKVWFCHLFILSAHLPNISKYNMRF